MHFLSLIFYKDDMHMNSLCPVLGKRHPKLLDIPCPSHLQDPFGKEINVVSRHYPPYSLLPPLSGGDLHIIKMLAKKHGIKPKFMFADFNEMTSRVSIFEFNVHESTLCGHFTMTGNSARLRHDMVMAKHPHNIIFKQVSRKQCEMGIGQLYFTIEEYGTVNYLPFMYQQELIFGSAKPQKIVSYDSIVYPFELKVWVFTIASIMAQFLLLQAMQHAWCKVTGSPNYIDYIYEGANENSPKYMKKFCS